MDPTYTAKVESVHRFRPCTVRFPLVPKVVSTAPEDVNLSKEYEETQPFEPQVFVSTLANTEPEGPAAMAVMNAPDPGGGAGKDTVPPLPHEVSRAPADVSRTRIKIWLKFEKVDPLKMNELSGPWTKS